MEEIIKTLDQHTASWSKGKLTWYKYQGFWARRLLLEGVIRAQQSFKAEPSDIFLCSCPKTGTTWLKALAFAIVTRGEESESHLLSSSPHECVPILEKYLEEIENNHKNSKSCPLVSTHIPYASLPESILASNCKIVYIYRNIKDAIVSHYHFTRGILNLSMQEASFEEFFQEYCEGISGYGPCWDHILGYWKASLQRPDNVLLLKYEDLKAHPTSNVKRLAEFIGYPFSKDEEEAGMVDSIVKLCSFENLSNLDVNKTRKRPNSPETRLYFRKAKEGDWENYFTDEMKEKIDKLMDQKMSGTGLILK